MNNQQTPKKVLITGAAGLLGSYLCNSLKDQYKVIALCHKKSLSVESDDLDVHYCDLNDSQVLNPLFDSINPDTVIHCAGMTNVENCELDPEHAYAINAECTFSIARIANSNSCKLIYISTDHLFDGKHSFYSEDESTSPLNVYAKSKLQGEKYIRDNFSNCLILRTNFFGKSLSDKLSFTDWIWKELSNQHSIQGFNDVYFTPISMPYLAKYLLELVSKGAVGTFNLCGSERVSKYEFITRFANYFGLNAELIRFSSISSKPSLIQRPADMSLSVSKIESELGVTMPTIDSSLKSIKSEYS